MKLRLGLIGLEPSPESLVYSSFSFRQHRELFGLPSLLGKPKTNQVSILAQYTSSPWTSGAEAWLRASAGHSSSRPWPRRRPGPPTSSGRAILQSMHGCLHTQLCTTNLNSQGMMLIYTDYNHDPQHSRLAHPRSQACVFKTCSRC